MWNILVLIYALKHLFDQYTMFRCYILEKNYELLVWIYDLLICLSFF